jgi:DNA-binding transcriptional MerR regulator
MAGPKPTKPAGLQLPDKRYFKIGEVCELAGLKPHVLRYWESEFKELKPPKGRSQHRLYRRQDIETVLRIKELLYEKRFTIAGAKQAFKEAGAVKKAAPAAGLEQLRLDFDSNDYKSILRSVFQELQALRSEIDKEPGKE